MRIDLKAEYLTPSGRRREQPLYSATIRNDFLGKECVVKGSDRNAVQRNCIAKLNKWAAEERTARKRSNAEALRENAKLNSQGLRSVLSDGLKVTHRIDWDSLIVEKKFPPFRFDEPESACPRYPSPPDPTRTTSWELVHSLYLKQCRQLDAEYRLEQDRLARRMDAAKKEYELAKRQFGARQTRRSERVQDLRRRFESGDVNAIREYFTKVFKRSDYPNHLFIEHKVSYDQPSRTAIVDVRLPPPIEVSDIVDYRVVKATGESKPIRLKEKDREQLYESVLHQVALRTLHEVFESDYLNHVSAVVVNGWVTALDTATGNDATSCIFSVQADREPFLSINLSRVDPSECFRSLKGIVAGPLAQLAPVKPILHLNRDDDRFVESREVLASINAHSNLAEIPWQEFEHLVRDLFEKEFAREGAQVKVTQSSRDGGVDAVAFDPDPIRGGKFVIQAKRYLKNVPVSAVRDLYGTMIHEGATKGILVTTSHYGRDARKFASHKPITLINGNELVYMLEKHGHKVRIDLDQAKANRIEQTQAASADADSRLSGDSK